MLKIHDRVLCVADSKSVNGPDGLEGNVVRYHSTNKKWVAVRFDSIFRNGHSCGMNIKYGYGSWILEKDLEKIEVADVQDKQQSEK